MGDFIPRSKGGYREWLQNLHDQIETEGPKFGLTAEQCTAVKNACAAMIAAMNAVIAAESALQSAQEAEIDLRTVTNKLLRDLINQWKEMPGFKAENAEALRLTASKTELDADNYKPEFKVKVVGGEIRIDWKKKQTDGVYIYGRLRGQGAWTRLGMDTSSPYIDGRPLAVAGVAEVREYMLRGMVADQEIGLDSDVLSVTWGG